MKEDVPLAHAGMAAQFDLQKQYYAEGKVFALQIESTLQCPQLCDYCYAGSTPESPQELSSATIRQLLDAAAALKVQMIDWLGGDPLMRRDWEALCTYATSLGLINNIWTSGIPLAKPGVAASAVKATKGGFISTHLDSLDRELYGILHGGEKRRGDLRHIGLILKGINNCLAAGKEPGDSQLHHLYNPIGSWRRPSDNRLFSGKVRHQDLRHIIQPRNPTQWK